MQDYNIPTQQRIPAKQYRERMISNKEISPATMGNDMKQLNSVLHKSNESLKNMPRQKKKEYAENKLGELKKMQELQLEMNDLEGEMQTSNFECGI